MRRIGKHGRRKVFRKVKNVNVKSPKNDSKLLDFWGAGVTGRVTSYCHFLFYVRYVCNVRFVRYVRDKRYVRFAPFASFAF